MKFDRKKVFDGFKANFTRVMTQQQVDGLEFLITSFERDPIWSDVRHIAYALATVWHETAYTFQPIQEFGSRAYFERRYGHQTRKGRELGNDAPGEGAKYSGKGYVQLTGKTNYEKLEKIIREQNPAAVREFETRTGQRFDLTDFAEQAKDPAIAFLIMTIGMFRGVYTGKALRHFINDEATDYYNARRIINGLDKAQTIAEYAKKFQRILESALIETVPTISEREADALLEVFPIETDTRIIDYTGTSYDIPAAETSQENPSSSLEIAKTEAPPPDSFSLDTLTGYAEKAQKTVNEGAVIVGRARDSINVIKEALPVSKPSSAPVKVTTGKTTAFWTQMWAGIASFIIAVINAVKENWIVTLVALFFMVAVAVTIGIIFYKMNAKKMEIAADPTKFNVE